MQSIRSQNKSLQKTEGGTGDLAENEIADNITRDDNRNPQSV